MGSGSVCADWRLVEGSQPAAYGLFTESETIMTLVENLNRCFQHVENKNNSVQFCTFLVLLLIRGNIWKTN